GRGTDLEESRFRHRPERGAQFHQDSGEFIPADWRAIDLDAFADIGEVRRSEQPGAVAGRAKDRGEHRRGGALALAAGDMQYTQAPMRLTNSPQHGPHALQLEIAGRWLAALEIDPAVPPGQ